MLKANHFRIPTDSRYVQIRYLSTTLLRCNDGLQSVSVLKNETFLDIKRHKKKSEKSTKPRKSEKRIEGLKPHRTFKSKKSFDRPKSPASEKVDRKPLPPISSLFSPSSPSPSSSTTKPANLPFNNFTSYETPFFKSFEINASELSYSPVDVPDQPPVPKLAHNLDRVLFSPGVHVLKDLRSNVYNFTPYLENIMSIKDFDFDFIAKYVPSGKDSTLAKLAQQNGKKYTGSTSSLTSVLTQFHHLLSHRRKPHTMSLSKYFKSQISFSAIQTMPVSLFLRYNPQTDTHSIDSDNSYSDDIIVSILGNQLEAMLTTPEAEFENYRKTLSHNLDPSLKGGLNTYNYTQSGDFLMRSQLDCYDERLPGTGMFDLKTRAVCAVRHDMDYTQIHDGSNYQISKIDGEFESFSREWFELIRSTMFKYSLQARIGRMDGIFLAYHNVRKMFGFQYVPLSEIDQIFHTSDLIDEEKMKSDTISSSYIPLDDKMAISGPLIADKEFKLSLKLFNNILDKIVSSHDAASSFNLVFHTITNDRMHIFVKPMLEKDIDVIQQTGCDSDATNSDDSEYSLNADPHTIMMHGNKNPDYLPPDVQLYQLEVKTYINGKFVPGDEHPHISQESDVWSIQCQLSQVRHASTKFTRTFTSTKSENRITSTVQTERLDESEEESIRQQALSKLAPPNAKQEYLRHLSEKGEIFQKEWDELHGHKEKQVWMPKTIEKVM